MKETSRNNCIISGNADLQHLYTFRKFPIFMGCVDSDDYKNDEYVDMEWYISKSSGMIQLNPVPSLESIYPTSHGSGTIGKTWQTHHQEFSKFILKYAGNEILEIGGGHGFLARLFLDNKPLSKWTLIDPNPTCLPTERLKVIKGFFPYDTSNNYDTIIHSHLFEHMLDPMDFSRKLFADLKSNGKIIFSIPNLGKMLELKYTNIINFEHTFLLTDYFVRYILENTGFNIIESELYLDDHSIFYVAQKDSKVQTTTLENQFKFNSKLFQDYIDFHLSLVSKINNIIDLTSSNVYLYGGHAMSQFLISFGIDTSKIIYILDNDSSKWDKRLNGTNLFVKSPQAISNISNPIVILRAGAFQNEIKQQLIGINNKVKIID